MSNHEDKSPMQYIYDRLKSIDETLIRQEESLKHHIYRTDLAETAIAALKSDVDPIKKHVAAVEGILKFLGTAAVLAGMAAGIVQVVEFFSK